VLGKPGANVVTLRSYIAADEVRTTTKTLRVGWRYLNAIQVLDLSFVNDQGQPGAASGRPNVRVDFAPSANVTTSNGDYSTCTHSEVLPGDLPLEFTEALTYGYPQAMTTLELTDTWRFQLRHMVPNVSTPVPMYSWLLPFTTPPTTPDSLGTGSYDLQAPAPSPYHLRYEAAYLSRRGQSARHHGLVSASPPACSATDS
jgi:hypothetical protein